MSDIVERLRHQIKNDDEASIKTLRALEEAADEIERLRAENVALSIDHAEMVNECRDIRAATIEECARLAEEWWSGTRYVPIHEVIRALKEQS